MEFDAEIGRLKENIISSTCELIRIKSVKSAPSEGKPFGDNINNALEYMLRLADSFGFRTKSLDGYAGYAEYGQGEKLVGVVVHLDVVPEGDGWIHPPYSGEISDNKIYGRGAIDDKGPAAAALYALKAVKDSGVRLDSRIRVIFGLDEESGSRCLEYYREKEEIPTYSFIPDASYPVIFSEKGVLTFNMKKQFKGSPGEMDIVSIVGGTRHNVVPDFCEAAVKASPAALNRIEQKSMDFFDKAQSDMELVYSSDGLLVKSYGVSSHASFPERGINAISQLMMFLKELDVPGEKGKFISFFCDHIGMETDGKSIGCSLSDKVSGSLTLNAGIVNLSGSEVELTLDIRYPVTYKSRELLDRINKYTNPHDIFITDIRDVEPLFVPPEYPLVKLLMEVYSDFTGQKAEPLSIGGGTYARSIPNAVAFGPLFPGEPELAHNKDEYISIESLIDNTRIFARAIYKLSQQ